MSDHQHHHGKLWEKITLHGSVGRMEEKNVQPLQYSRWQKKVQIGYCLLELFLPDGTAELWEIELDGNTLTATWGLIGSDGHTKAKEFSDASKAQAEYDRLVKEKTSRGYLESTT